VLYRPENWHPRHWRLCAIVVSFHSQGQATPISYICCSWIQCISEDMAAHLTSADTDTVSSRLWHQLPLADLHVHLPTFPNFCKIVVMTTSWPNKTTTTTVQSSSLRWLNYSSYKKKLKLCVYRKYRLKTSSPTHNCSSFIQTSPASNQIKSNLFSQKTSHLDTASSKNS